MSIQLSVKPEHPRAPVRVLPVLALLPARSPLRRNLLRCGRTLHRRRRDVALCRCFCAGGIGAGTNAAASPPRRRDSAPDGSLWLRSLLLEAPPQVANHLDVPRLRVLVLGARGAQRRPWLLLQTPDLTAKSCVGYGDGGGVGEDE
jgi:hypothetical protein